MWTLRTSIGITSGMDIATKGLHHFLLKRSPLQSKKIPYRRDALLNRKSQRPRVWTRPLSLLCEHSIHQHNSLNWPLTHPKELFSGLTAVKNPQWKLVGDSYRWAFRRTRPGYRIGLWKSRWGSWSGSKLMAGHYLLYRFHHGLSNGRYSWLCCPEGTLPEERSSERKITLKDVNCCSSQGYRHPTRGESRKNLEVKRIARHPPNLKAVYTLFLRLIRVCCASILMYLFFFILFWHFACEHWVGLFQMASFRFLSSQFSRCLLIACVALSVLLSLAILAWFEHDSSSHSRDRSKSSDSIKSSRKFAIPQFTSKENHSVLRCDPRTDLKHSGLTEGK